MRNEVVIHSIVIVDGGGSGFKLEGVMICYSYILKLLLKSVDDEAWASAISRRGDDRCE